MENNRLEKIFNANAKRYMAKFDLVEFRRDYSRLYHAILKSMAEVSGTGGEKEKGSGITKPEEVKYGENGSIIPEEVVNADLEDAYTNDSFNCGNGNFMLMYIKEKSGFIIKAIEPCYYTAKYLQNRFHNVDKIRRNNG